MSLCTRPWSRRVLTPPVCWSHQPGLCHTSPEGATHQRLLGDESLLSQAREQPQGQRHLVRLGCGPGRGCSASGPPWEVGPAGGKGLVVQVLPCALSLPVPHPPAPSSLPEPDSRARPCCAPGSVQAGHLEWVSCALESPRAPGQILGSKKAASGHRSATVTFSQCSCFPCLCLVSCCCPAGV